MERLRKAFVAGIIFTTVLSMSVVVAPNVGAAAADGDLIKMDGLSSVYYLSGGKRYVFPNEQTYFSWYGDFSSVKTIPQSELESYPLAKNVAMRSGTKLVKITTDPKVYAVEPNGSLVWVPSEAVASALYGANWAKRVVDIPDAFFTNYTVSSSQVSASAYPAGSLVKWAGSADVYYISADGKAQKIATEAAFEANRFNWNNVNTAPASVAMPAAGADITGAVASIIDTSSGAGGTAGAGTGLMVSLASNTPATSNIPNSATGVVFTKVNFTASQDGDTTITGLVVKRSALGAYNDLPKVYIYDGATRLTTGKSISASTNEALFHNLSIVIAKGTTKTLSLVADIAATGGYNALGIASASAITTNGAGVSGSFPVTGNAMSISTVSVGKTDVESNTSNNSKKIGETNVDVASFTVNVNNTEDAQFKGITLYNSGRDILNNLKMYRGSDLVATAVKSGSNFVFTLATPYEIAKGQSATFTVKGDIGGRKGDTATLYVRYSADVVVVGKTYGYNLTVDGTIGGNATASYVDEAVTGTVTALSSNTTTAQAGQLTVAWTAPNAATVSKNTNNVVLMKFNLTAQNNLDISKFTVAVSGTNLHSGDLENLDLMIDGVIVGTKSTVATTTNNVFTENFSLPAGRTVEGQIVVDVTTSATGNETLFATVRDLTNTVNFVAKTNDGDTITEVIPSGDIIGKTMTVAAATLTYNLGSSPASGQTFVKNSTNAPVVGFAFTAGPAADVKITSLKYSAYLKSSSTAAWVTNQTSGARTVITSVGIYDAAAPDTLLAPKKALTIGATDITVTFDSLGFVVPKGTSKVLIAKVDLSNSFVNNDGTDIIALDIAAVGSIVAEYGSGTNLTAQTGISNNNPDAGVFQTVTDSGTLTMSLDAGTPVANLVLAGAQGVPFTKVKFSASKEAFTISKLRVTNSANSSNFTSIALQYVDKNGVTQTQAGSFVGTVSNFTGLSIYVDSGKTAVVTVLGNMNTIGGGAANENASALTVDTTADFKASAASGDITAVSSGATAATGAAMTLYKSVPTVAFASNTPSGTLIPATNTHVGKINITADGGDDITFSNITSSSSIRIYVNTATQGDVFGKAISVKNKNGETLCSGTVATSSTENFFNCNFATKALSVGAGTTEAIDVYLDTTSLSIAGKSVQLSLNDSLNSNFIWGIVGTGNYNTGTITLRGNKYGGSLVKP